MKKLTALITFGAGYVLGTRAGRERYEQISRTFSKVKNDPRVQEKAHQAADLAKEKAPVVSEKFNEAASSVKDKVSSSNGSDPSHKLHPDSTARQEDPYPNGPLP